MKSNAVVKQVADEADDAFAVMVANVVADGSYTTQMEADAMEPRIPKGAVLLIDGQVEPKSGDIVDAGSEFGAPGRPAIVRELVIKGEQRYLRALNDGYPSVILEHDLKVFGVVCAVCTEV